MKLLHFISLITVIFFIFCNEAIPTLNKIKKYYYLTQEYLSSLSNYPSPSMYSCPKGPGPQTPRAGSKTTCLFNFTKCRNYNC